MSESAAGVDFDAAPWTYPGRIQPGSHLVLPWCEHELRLQPGGLAQARVMACERCGTPPSTLDDTLAGYGAAPVRARMPLVAVGSNGSAEVLRGKLHRANLRAVVPTLDARVHNVRPGHSAHVSRPGFVPAAPAHLDGEIASVKVSLVDSAELGRIDLTEPNYRRQLLSGQRYPLELDDGASIGSFWIYESHWGVLAENRVPISLLPQSDLANWFSARGLGPWHEWPMEEAMRVLASMEQLRTAAREAFVQAGLRTGSDLVHQ